MQVSPQDDQRLARYLAHVTDFPLESIRDDEHLDSAIAKIDRLLDQPALSPGDEMYLSALSDLVALYETEHIPIPEVRGTDILRHLMEENDLRQKDLVPLLGSTSIVSEILSGKRPLTLAHITKLSERFGLPTDVLLNR